MGEDMKQDGVGKGMWAVMRVVGGEMEEGEAGGGVETEATEEGVGEVVGVFEGEIVEGLRTVENEEAGDSVEEFGVREVCCFLTKLPLERNGRMKRALCECECEENGFFEEGRTKHLRSIDFICCCCL